MIEWTEEGRIWAATDPEAPGKPPMTIRRLKDARNGDLYYCFRWHDSSDGKPAGLRLLGIERDLGTAKARVEARKTGGTE